MSATQADLDQAQKLLHAEYPGSAIAAALDAARAEERAWCLQLLYKHKLEGSVLLVATIRARGTP
jgi:hypothetical protein